MQRLNNIVEISQPKYREYKAYKPFDTINLTDGNRPDYYALQSIWGAYSYEVLNDPSMPDANWEGVTSSCSKRTIFKHININPHTGLWIYDIIGKIGDK